MVNNLEKYKSINFYTYCKMDQKKHLLATYTHEYKSYQHKLERYELDCKIYNDLIEHNEKVRFYAEDKEKIYDYWLNGGQGTLAYKIIPPKPSKPAFMEHPLDIDVFDHYKIEKFTKGWMLNVSPNWKGCVITREMLNFFIAVIESFYDNCDRFIKMKYVLENGHGRDHLHAHIVFTLNVKKPGYMTPIKKGKILTEFRNCWNRLVKDNSSLDDLTIDDEWLDPEGYYCDKRKRQIGLVDERCALNTCLLTKPEMLQDKLDYLQEELKPESHKNDIHHLCPLRGSRGYE